MLNTKWLRQQRKEGKFNAYEFIENNYFILAYVSIVLFSLACAFLIIFWNPTEAKADVVDMHKIMMIESGGNPNLQEKWGGMGLYQITLPTLAEYDVITNHNYKQQDLFDGSVNRLIADWYLNHRIPSMLKHYRRPVTARNIIITYNAGISYVAYNKKLPKTTINYLKKYGA